MTKYAGIVYKEDRVLYCEDCGTFYWVINGQWGFAKHTTNTFIFTESDGKIIGSKGIDADWTIVLPDMPWYDNWQEACDVISNAIVSSSKQTHIQQFSMFEE